MIFVSIPFYKLELSMIKRKWNNELNIQVLCTYSNYLLLRVLFIAMIVILYLYYAKIFGFEN